MEAADVLQTLRATDHAEVPREALAAARARREEITPALIESLHAAAQTGAEGTPEQAALASYALYLLAEFREAVAFPAVEQLFRLPEELLEEITGDIFIEDGPTFLAATAGAGAEGTGRLRRLAEDGAAAPELRRVALRALTLRVAWGEAPHDEAAAYLARYFHGRWTGLAEPEDVMMLAHVCLDLGVTAAGEDIRAALERHPPELPKPGDAFPIPPLLTWREVEQEFREGPGRGWRYQTADHEFGPLEQAEEACAWWHGHGTSEGEERPTVEEFLPYVAPPKTGRNDPCPCGSGKKFKKCCGAD